jgi:hypothetical protein
MRGHPNRSPQSSGGNCPSAISTRRNFTVAAWLMFSTWIVTRPTGVNPTSLGPRHWKWSDHRSRRGWYSGVN